MWYVYHYSAEITYTNAKLSGYQSKTMLWTLLIVI